MGWVASFTIAGPLLAGQTLPVIIPAAALPQGPVCQSKPVVELPGWRARANFRPGDFLPTVWLGPGSWTGVTRGGLSFLAGALDMAR